MANFDSLKFATEGISGGATTILADNADLPSFMNPFYKKTNKQLFDGSDVVHSAWKQGTVEKDAFYMSKFINYVVNGRAYSWPNVIPANSYNFDTEMGFCNAKGTGWHQASFPEWAAIVHLMHKLGFEPRGNTNYGKSHSYPYESGAADSTGRTTTGSGPVSWNHDGTPFGICDFVGDVWKRLSGMRMVAGELQVMEGNAPAMQVSHADGSTYWKAIAVDGSLVAPGTSGSLHVNASGNIGTTIVTTGSSNKAFSGIVAADSITLPELIFELLLAPVSGVTNYGNFYWNLESERVPFRGGSFSGASNAGSSALNLSNLRSFADGRFGFFSAYQV
jgi:hypothetical protein